MRAYLVRAFGRYAAFTGALFVLWFALSGYFHEPTLVAFGAVSVFLVVFLSERAGVLDREGVPTAVFPGILGYMVWLTLEIGKANLAVIREIIRPKLRLSPSMIRVKAEQDSDVGRTIFGNSITLTPGTVTVDVGEDWMLVHALTDELADVDAIEAMGEKVSRLEGPSAIPQGTVKKGEH